MSTSTSPDNLVVMLGWEPDLFFTMLKESSVEDMEWCLKILDGPDRDEHMAMLSNAARLGIVEEALARERLAVGG